MKKKLSLLATCILFSISFAVAQNKINGHWTGIVRDQYKVAYDFQAHGDTLTGKDTHYDGSVSDISNGKIMGDSLSFDVPIQGSTIHMTGKITAADALSLYFTIQGTDVTLAMKKTDAK